MVKRAPEYDPQWVDLMIHLFSEATVQRGLGYAVGGRVRPGKVELEDGQVHVQAQVRGTAPGLYQVSIWLDAEGTDPDTGYDSDCTCPVGYDCKHVVAVLATVRDLPEVAKAMQLIDGSAATADLASSDTATEITIEPSPAALEWLAGFNQTDAAASSANGLGASLKSAKQCVVYLLSAEQPNRMSLGKSRVLKTGAMGKPVPYRPQTFDLGAARSAREFIAEEDVEPLRLFLALQSSGNYYYQQDVELTGETGALLLRQALATGRLFFDNQIDSPLKPGPALPLSLRWTRTADGQQNPGFDLPESAQVLTTWPLYYIDAQHATVGELSSAFPEAVLKRWMNAPPLNEADALLVRQQLVKLARELHLEVPLPEAQETSFGGTPTVEVTLGLGRFRYVSINRVEDTHAIASLHFHYPNGPTVAASEHPIVLMTHQVDGVWRTLERDVESEQKAWRLLQEFGFESYKWRLPNYTRTDATGDCLMPARSDAHGWLAFLGEGAKLLAERGIKVTLASDFPYRIEAADDWFVELDDGEQSDGVGNNWFNLDLGVRINGERVSLVPPLLRLLRERPKLLATVRALDDDQSFPVPLDERRILPVPAARLKSWLLPLLELLDDDRPRLSRYHAAMLAGLSEQPAHWVGGEKLLELGQRLRDFSGITECLPAEGFNATLRPYQQAGLNWLQFLREYGLAGILADDMGLGKTVQTLAHLHLEKASGRANLPSLVIGPTSLLTNWRNEAAQFTPNLTILTLHGKDRFDRFHEMATVDLILTTYPLLVRDRDVLMAQKYHLLVMDEAQFIKNPKAQSHQVARQLKARHRLSLTGTPLENHLGELWAQFDFLMPGLLSSASRFTQVFRSPIEKQGDEEMRVRLADRVRPFLLRRTKEEVLTDLPPRTEMIRWVEIEGGQRDLYESLRAVFDTKLRQALLSQGVGRSQIMILDALLKLRQVCCDPRLVKLAAAEAVVAKGLAPSAKLATLMEMLDELLDEGRKVLLFSQFTSMLELIEIELEKRDYKYTKLTGQTKDREAAIEEFQQGRVPLFLISLKAGGTGLNLTAADTVIHYDPWWNPAVEEQATARAHRIGQDKPVFVYKLLTQGTVEEKILALQNRKRGLADQLLTAGGAAGATGVSGGALTAADLDVLFQPLPG
ncbi:MAG: DEAD/DEAH box helicase [Rhodocyclaceae bacterium]|nr:DEAD/DEAH box helicase [Rhodocyclaceae bacterium]